MFIKVRPVGRNGDKVIINVNHLIKVHPSPGDKGGCCLVMTEGFVDSLDTVETIEKMLEDQNLLQPLKNIYPEDMDGCIPTFGVI